MRLTLVLRIAMPLVIVLLTATNASAQDAHDPQAIFDAARRAWAFTSYPRYANYRVGVHYRKGTAASQRHYDTLQDLRRDIVFAHTFSREETANPSFPPHGVNFGMLGITLNAGDGEDPIGPFALAVTYDFGISLANRPTQIAQMGSEITAPARYPVIGTSGTTARTYTVRLIETLDGGATYHLGLVPLRDPKRYRLREMWVDAATFVTRKILVAGNFNRAPFTDVAWTISYTQIGGGPYITREEAQGTLDFGGSTLEDVTVTFDDLTTSSALPLTGTVGINGGPPDFISEP